MVQVCYVFSKKSKEMVMMVVWLALFWWFLLAGLKSEKLASGGYVFALVVGLKCCFVNGFLCL